MIEAKIPKQLDSESESEMLEAMAINPDELTSFSVKNFYKKITHDIDLPPGAFWKAFKIKKNGFYYEALCLFFCDGFNNSVKHDTTFLFPLEEQRKSYFLIRDNEELEKTLLIAMN